jgi:hypothetical protein
MILTDEGFAMMEIRRLRVAAALRRTVMRAAAALLAFLQMTACAPRRLNVMHTTQQTLITIGYSADRSQSIFRADNEAQLFCERQGQAVVFLQQDTIYQGRYDEDVTATARTAGRVAGALGSPKAERASRALSSPTDYKTTFEFLCR